MKILAKAAKMNRNTLPEGTIVHTKLVSELSLLLEVLMILYVEGVSEHGDISKNPQNDIIVRHNYV